MNIFSLLSEVYELGFSLSVNENRKLVIHSNDAKLSENLLSKLRQSKEEIISFLVENTKEKKIVELTKFNVQEVPLTHAQLRLWLNEQDRKTQHVIRAAFEIIGPLDVEKLKNLCGDIVSRLRMLRVRIFESSKGIIQRVDNATNFSEYFKYLKCTDKDMIDFINTTFSEKFYFNKPLFQLRLVEVSEKNFFFLLKAHHLILDGISISYLFKEISHLYQNKESIYCNDFQYDYIDFAAWEQTKNAKNYYQPYIEYWLKELNDFEVLDLPKIADKKLTDKTAGSHQLNIEQELANRITHIASYHSVTPNVIFLSALYLVLSRYSGKNDLIIGIPISNRFIEEIQKTIGLFVNTIPLRVDVSECTTVSILNIVQNKLLSALQYATAPFDMVFSELPKEQRKKNPFEVVFNYLDQQDEFLTFPEVQVKPIFTPAASVQNSINIAIKVQKKIFVINIDYDAEYFDADSIKIFSQHFLNVLENLLGEEKPISRVDILKKEERRKILIDWNYINKIYSPKNTIHQFFEEQVVKNPNKTAIVFGSKKLTYLELNIKSNQLAHLIRVNYKKKNNKDLLPNTLISLCVERSLEMIISILAILKSGAAYVPLDPDYPVDRLLYIIGDSQNEMIIIQQHILERINIFDGAHQDNLLIINNNLVKQELEEQSSANLSAFSGPNDLAYVIYTSGSMGKPKGVLLPHHNVVRLFLSTDCLYQFNDKDVWTLFHSYAFDFSVWEIWGALFYGGKLIIVPYMTCRDPMLFYNLLFQEKVTVLNQTPGAFQQLIPIDKECKNKINTLRYVIFGGDSLNIETLRSWWDSHSDKNPQLVNMYGITETTVHVTYGALTKQHLAKNNFGFIGKRINDLQLYVLDSYGNICPIGVPGELYVGGHGLASGYLNRQKLTNESFTLNPFSEEMGLLSTDKIYKTGDLVRWHVDGNLEYLGRADLQVKIRGFRIELGEIENVLSQHTSISQACVLVIENKGIKYLAAYYVLVKREAELNIDRIRKYLLEKLPEYMLPTAFIRLDKISLTSNGKVNRKILPRPDINLMTATYVAPCNEIEQTLSDIWCRVLGLKKVGRNDNFFHLGGDSISLMQVTAELREKGMYIMIRSFFEHPVLNNMAEKITLYSAKTPQFRSVQGRQIITPIQCWFFDDIKNVNFSNQLFRLKINISVNVDNLQKAIKYITNYHDIFSLKFNKTKNSWSAKYKNKNNFYFKTYDLKDLSIDIKMIKLQDIGQRYQALLDITKGPLAAFIHFKLDNADERLLIIINHLIIDGVSWRILIEDLSQAYKNLEEKGMAELSFEKSSSYQSWAENICSEKISENVINYWNKFTERTYNEFPVDYQKSENNYGSSRKYRVILSSASTKKLLTETVRNSGAHINTLLLAPLALALRDTFAITDVLVDLESHGRLSANEEENLTRTIGWFTNIYPVCLTVSPFDNPKLIVNQLETTLNAIPNNGLGFLKLKYNMQKSRLLEMQPDISFNYLGQFSAAIFQNTIFKMAEEYYGEPVAPENIRKHKLNVVTVITDAQLKIDWNYSINQFSEATIKKFANRYREYLEKIIAWEEIND